DAGYNIIGLPIAGFQRKITFKNIAFFWKLLVSLQKSRKIIKDFQPDVAVGVGGFASGPILQTAAKKGIPCLIQEQNSYPGITNKILASKVQKICVAYEGMERYFPKEKIIMTGNPVRQDLENIFTKKEEGLKHFHLQGNKKILLVVGGSLGARTINQSILKHLDFITENKIQVIWQTGKTYYDTAVAAVEKLGNPDIKVFQFIQKMDFAFAVADLVISRAGASTISELCLVKKPSILVPSPNVAEDHQTKNAMALIKNNAALMIEDKESVEKLVPEAIALLKDNFRLNAYTENISKMAFKNSADVIADEIIKMIK
ncbi:MAG: undecaprenyldiphospho-muramoylpentapeptide beta-N-acetylglucosaminyltransferase, partial [Bacteroidetes bacterium RIFOXYA12_FULL_33_9]